MRPEDSDRAGSRRSRRHDRPRGRAQLPAAVSVSLPDRLGRLGRAGAGVLLVLGLASGLEPIIQAASSSPASAQTNLIQNGSFEEPTNTSDASLPAGSTGINGITDWTIGGNSVNLDSLPYWQAVAGPFGQLSGVGLPDGDRNDGRHPVHAFLVDGRQPGMWPGSKDDGCLLERGAR